MEVFDGAWSKAGARFSIGGAYEFRRFRFSGANAGSVGKDGGQQWGLGFEMELFQSRERLTDRNCYAGEAATGALIRGNQLFRTCVALLLFLSGLAFDNAARDRHTPDALFLYGRRLLCFPFADGVLSGSHFDSSGVRDFGDSFDGIGDQLSAAVGQSAGGVARGGTGAIRLSGAVFLRLFLQWIHWTFDYGGGYCDVVCGDAMHGETGLGAAFYVAAGARPNGTAMKFRPILFNRGT